MFPKIRPDDVSDSAYRPTVMLVLSRIILDRDE